MSAAIFRAVLLEGEARAHIADERSDERGAYIAYTLCGEMVWSGDAIGGLHGSYCQTCVARLGAREVTP